MANTLLTLVDITNEAARVLTNDCLLANSVNSQYEARFAVDGKKAGDTINVRKPPRYIGRRGEQASIEASTEQFVPLTLEPLFGCDIQFSTTDLTLNISDFSNRFVKPMVAAVANSIDVFMATKMYQPVYNQAGTPGTNPATQADALNLMISAGQRLHEQAAPNDGNRQAIIGPSMQGALVGNMAGLFNPATTVSRHFKTGAMGDDVLGFNFAMDQNMARHSSGATLNPATTGTLSATVAEGATTIAVTGLTASATLKVGDLIRITGFYGVNPQSRVQWGTAADQRFTVTVTEDITLNGSGAGTVKISPTIRGPGSQFQNVNALPTSGAVITVISIGATAGSASQGMAYHKDAFTFASVDLELPGGDQEAHRVNENGIACRLWKGYNINSNAMICRFDVLCGMTAVYPELAVRLVGA